MQYGKHFKNAFVWLALSSLVGFAPLLFLQLIDALSEEDIAGKEIGHLLQGKFILFVSCALTGSVAFDFIRSKFKTTGWLSFFAIYISPFCMLFYLFLKYLLVYVQFDDVHDFGPGSLTTKFVVGFSAIYCLFVKTLYYIKEENARHHFSL